MYATPRAWEHPSRALRRLITLVFVASPIMGTAVWEKYAGYPKAFERNGTFVGFWTLPSQARESAREQFTRRRGELGK